jgi:hypothetical protein
MRKLIRSAITAVVTGCERDDGGRHCPAFRTSANRCVPGSEFSVALPEKSGRGGVLCAGLFVWRLLLW